MQWLQWLQWLSDNRWSCRPRIVLAWYFFVKAFGVCYTCVCQKRQQLIDYSVGMTKFPWVFIAKANFCLTEVQMNASTSSSLRADSHWNCCMQWNHVWLRIKILEVTQVCKISQQLTRRGYCEMLPNEEDAMSDVYSCFEVCNSAWMGLWTGQAKWGSIDCVKNPSEGQLKRQVWDPS